MRDKKGLEVPGTVSLNRKIIPASIGCVFSLLVAVSPGAAKNRNLQRSVHHWPARLSAADLRTFEERLTPFLAERSARRGHGRTTTTSPTAASIPSESDLMLLPKVWSRLSAEFRMLYRMAAQLPDTFATYLSPGGHFEILYTTSGNDGVDTTDRYGYDTPDWRHRSGEPNGVPDYVDETAFALDSSWSMEVGRFGFVSPVSVRDDLHPSDRYKVVIETQWSGYYGVTYLDEQLDDDRGYSSSISIRNDWSGTEWSSLGYDVTPSNGLRVTCAHEFFHAIQYTMSWHVVDDVWLDDFPLSWTEGCAVTMEELAFDSVNDYLQYATSYFQNPATMSFFDRPASDFDYGYDYMKDYSNALLLLYIYYHSPAEEGIDFIRSMHFTNYNKKMVFYENLRQTSLEIGSQWPDLLHSFHTASFFTGDQADPARFLPDAASFTMKRAPQTALPATLSGTVSTNGVNHFRFTPSEQQTDTLTLRFTGAPECTEGFPYDNWLVTMLLRKNGTDSLVPLATDETGAGTLAISSWRSVEEATIVVTNADPLLDRTYTLECNIDSIIPAGQVDLYPNPVSIRRHHGTTSICGTDISDIAVYSLNGTLVWRLPEQPETVSSVRQRHTLACRSSNGTSFAPGTYTVFITRSALSKLTPQRLRRTLLITP